MRLWSISGATAAILVSMPLRSEPVPANSSYAHCPAQDVLQSPTRVSWTKKIDSAIPEHEKLRRALNAPMPTGAYRVLLYWIGGDLQTTRLSLVAVRTPDGRWHTNEVGQSVIWIQGAKPTPVPPVDRDLNEEDSKRVDALLDDPCLYDGPAYLERPAVGAGITTLEVETPKRHWRAGWSAEFTPEEEELAHLLGPKD